MLDGSVVEDTERSARSRVWLAVIAGGVIMLVMGLLALLFQFLPDPPRPHTWVDDVEVFYSAADWHADYWNHRDDPALKQLPYSWVNSTDSQAKLVIDRVTGSQVFVINEGWREGSRVMYRVLRLTRVNEHEYSEEEKNWRKVQGRHGEFWVTEDRCVDELRPIPEV